MNILTEYPVWFTPLCLVTGILFAFFLYYKDKRAEFTLTIKWILAIGRFLSVSILAFLFLAPLFKTNVKEVEKPVVLFFQDDSQSIVLGADSVYMREQYGNDLASLLENLKTSFEISTFSFGAEIVESETPVFNMQRTNMSEISSLIEKQFLNRNIGALIIAGDGIYNAGLNPVYSFQEFGFPVYTIALGDTVVRKDARINDVNYNELAFLGNDFPVEINVQAYKCNKQQLKLEIYKDNTIIDQHSLIVNDDNFNENVKFLLPAKEPGMQHYSVRLSRLDNEISYENNMADVFIDIIDTRFKILLLYNSAHPDVAAINSVLEKDVNYEVEIMPVRDFDKQIEEYNLVILHQLPSKTYSSYQLNKKIKDSGVPVLYILGAQSSISLFNSWETGLLINNYNNVYEDVFPVRNSGFTLFGLSEETQSLIRDLPPLYVLFGDYRLNAGAQVLLEQQIGNVRTNEPLICLNASAGTKTGIVCGEGLWRWRMENNKSRGNQKAFDEIIGKTIRFLTLHADKSNFRVETRNKVFENEDVVFEAELYNENFELIFTPEISLTITDENNNTFPYNLGRKGNKYFLNAGKFPVGNYSYSASTHHSDEKYTSTGEFVVSGLNVESVRLNADHNLLYRLATSHNGKLFYPEQLDLLADELLGHEEMKPLITFRKKYSELINLPWLMGVIIFILAFEWFIRKWSGAY